MGVTAVAMAQAFMCKMWVQDKIDGCKLSEEEARDPTKMKASTFARWIGLIGCAIMFFAGGYVLATYGGGDDDAVTNSTNSTNVATPTAAPTEDGDGDDDPICLVSGGLCIVLSIPIMILEIGYFVLKPNTEKSEDELAGPPPPKEPGVKDDEGADADGASEGEGDENKPGMCKRCCGCCMRCQPCRCFYESWYVRALLYAICSIFMFPCSFTLPAGVLLLLCAFLYAFAQWRGEILPTVEEEAVEAPPEEEEVEERPQKEKKRKKKPGKAAAI